MLVDKDCDSPLASARDPEYGQLAEQRENQVHISEQAHEHSRVETLHVLVDGARLGKQPPLAAQTINGRAALFLFLIVRFVVFACSDRSSCSEALGTSHGRIIDAWRTSHV